MSRETSPFIVGDYWLDKRRDGRAREIWQIATYSTKARSIVYRSTNKRSLDDAKNVIHAYVNEQLAKRPQQACDARLIPNLMVYWHEHGSKVESPSQIASSIRQFIGFLNQDQVGLNATVAEANPALFVRFREWRMAPHSYAVPWAGKMYSHASQGVKGESVQRNLDDIRAGLHHQAKNHRIPAAPKVDGVPQSMRSVPRDRVLSQDEMGAIFGFAAYDIDLFRELCLVLATLARTEAANTFDPRQYDPRWGPCGLIDLQPLGKSRTAKRNPIIPCVPEFAPILAQWAIDGASPVRSRKTRWRTLRRALGLGSDVDIKTIRHTVATRLRGLRIFADDLEYLLGHRVYKRTTAVYAKYDPAFMAESVDMLSTIFRETMAAAYNWGAVHIRTTSIRGKPISVAKRGAIA